jgi:hypothetical protein
MIELRNPIAVHTPHGAGKCILIFDYGFDVNSVFGVRLDESGQFKHYYSDDILIYNNPMNGEPNIKIPENWKQ